MSHARMSYALSLLVAAFTAQVTPAVAQNDYRNPNMTPVNDLPNPYSGKEVMPLPGGRTWGSTAGVDVGKGRNDVWAIDRCGSNGCVGSHDDPLLHYDAERKAHRPNGSRLVCVPARHPRGRRGQRLGDRPVAGRRPRCGRQRGAASHEAQPERPRFCCSSARGMVAGDGPNQFSSPSDVVVGRNGDIFVADGHAEGTNERIMKFDKDGKFIKAWGKPGNGACGAGEFSSLHALAIDSRGRLFIGDRDNNRIQLYDQDGNYLDCWYQFSRPSGIFIDADDNLFVTDSESRDGAAQGLDLAHPGWQRGIRIGSARDGSVKYFIPDPDPQGGSSTSEGVAAINGGAVVYGAEVGPKSFVRYDRK